MDWKDIDDTVFLIPAMDMYDFDRRDEPSSARITGYATKSEISALKEAWNEERKRGRTREGFGVWVTGKARTQVGTTEVSVRMLVPLLRAMVQEVVVPKVAERLAESVLGMLAEKGLGKAFNESVAQGVARAVVPEISAKMAEQVCRDIGAASETWSREASRQCREIASAGMAGMRSEVASVVGLLNKGAIRLDEGAIRLEEKAFQVGTGSGNAHWEREFRPPFDLPAEFVVVDDLLRLKHSDGSIRHQAALRWVDKLGELADLLATRPGMSATNVQTCVGRMWLEHAEHWGDYAYAV